MTGDPDAETATSAGARRSETAGGRAARPAVAALGIEVSLATAERAEGSVPYDAPGDAHGAAGLTLVATALVDTLARAAATVHAGAGRAAVPVDVNATHHAADAVGTPGRGRLTGVATPVHRGRSVATYAVVVEAPGGQRTCTARVTCLLRADHAR